MSETELIWPYGPEADFRRICDFVHSPYPLCPVIAHTICDKCTCWIYRHCCYGRFLNHIQYFILLLDIPKCYLFIPPSCEYKILGLTIKANIAYIIQILCIIHFFWMCDKNELVCLVVRILRKYHASRILIRSHLLIWLLIYIIPLENTPVYWP